MLCEDRATLSIPSQPALQSQGHTWSRKPESLRTEDSTDGAAHRGLNPMSGTLEL